MARFLPRASSFKLIYILVGTVALIPVIYFVLFQREHVELSTPSSSISRPASHGHVDPPKRKRPSAPIHVAEPLDVANAQKAGTSESARHPVLEKIIAGAMDLSYMPPITDALQRKLEEFQERQTLAAKGQYRGKWTRCSPSGQMGNRIRYALACFLFSLVTDRALAVQFADGFYGSLNDLFALPVPVESRDFPSSGGGRIASVNFPTNVEQVHCSNLRDSFASDDVVHFVAADAYYFVPHIFQNPHHHDELLELFPDQRMAEKLAWWLMPPNKEVWDIVRDTYSRLLADASYLIGIQVRSNTPPEPSTWITPEEYTAMNECSTQITPPSLRSDAKWFIAADSGKAIKETMEALDASHAVYRWKPEEFKLSGTADGLRHAVADVILLALSDAMIICTWSSYGQMAATYHMKPVYWVSDYKFPRGDDYAWHDVVVDHCYHLKTTEYSARQYSEWAKSVSCFTEDMAPSWWL